ncbi:MULTISPECIES: IS630 family transposase [Nitrosomonas]|uniref:Transposase n=2 Tax=Nitrosomonas communis TaxID=44574 RepID=A0A0F7KCC3_9PROT|nr:MULTISPECIES: IS630 family transposase [Nitrosomonas]AKH37251.1 transposase [Nitrosomonas communis]UVS62453.1 IS630 family transposase [Nitrosomonas sp. PLL12]
MTYPILFRHKVLSVREKENLSIAQVAKRFGVGVASVMRWIKTPDPKTTRNKPATRINMEMLAQDIKNYPDAHQYERAKRLGVSKQSINHALKRLSVTYKKSLCHPKASEEERRIFQQKIEDYERAGRVIVYLDKSGFAHDMPRTHGYAPVGERVHGVKNWHARGRTNVIGALIGKTLLTISLFIANITADIFYAWITHDLLPILLPACVIVMDNATFHKRQDIQTAIANAGHTLEYLPPYSPDLNDIEPKWAQAKAIRKREGCSIEQLFAAYEI